MTRKRANGRPQIHVGLWIDQTLEQRLRRLADAHDTDVSKLIRSAIRNHLETTERRLGVFPAPSAPAGRAAPQPAPANAQS